MIWESLSAKNLLSRIRVKNKDNDEIWRLLRSTQPIKRDHVALNACGVADDHLKFERSAVPTGTKFLFEITMRCQSPEFSKFNAVLDKFFAEGFAMGGATRSGYGALKPELIQSRCFDLKSERSEYCEYAAKSLSEPFVGDPYSPQQPPVTDFAVITLALRSEGYFLIGSNTGPITVGKPPDSTPYRELQINWKNGSGSIPKEELVVPGSSIKGPLRHRSLFHYKRLGGKDPGAIAHLFGAARNEETNEGGAGLVFVDDARPPDGFDLQKSTGRVPHVGIDRFSGGVRRRVLFTDEAIWRIDLDVKIRIKKDETLESTISAAFLAAIEDLKRGWLQLGAGGGEGYGVFYQRNEVGS